MKRTIKSNSLTAAVPVALGMLAAALWVAPAAVASDSPRIAPPNSNVYGKSYAEWFRTYWQWWYEGGQDPAQSQIGKVQLLAVPNGQYVKGSNTPEDPSLYCGTLEITVHPDTPLVLPLVAAVWERYDNGTPDDVPMADSDFLATLTPTLTIDGKTVLSDANKADFLVPVLTFDPPMLYPQPTDYHSIGVVAIQTIGIVSTPLPVGVHTIHLYEPYIMPGFWAVIYDNTWTITVTPH